MSALDQQLWGCIIIVVHSLVAESCLVLGIPSHSFSVCHCSVCATIHCDVLFVAVHLLAADCFVTTKVIILPSEIYALGHHNSYSHAGWLYLLEYTHNNMWLMVTIFANLIFIPSHCISCIGFPVSAGWPWVAGAYIVAYGKCARTCYYDQLPLDCISNGGRQPQQCLPHDQIIDFVIVSDHSHTCTHSN